MADLLAHMMGLTMTFRDAALDRAVGLSGRDPNWPSQS